MNPLKAAIDVVEAWRQWRDMLRRGKRTRAVGEAPITLPATRVVRR